VALREALKAIEASAKSGDPEGALAQCKSISVVWARTKSAMKKLL
jgi:hypothetical protein